MRSEFAGITGALGLTVLLSYGVIVVKPRTRAAAIKPWIRRDKRFTSEFYVWAAVTVPTAAFFLLLWYDQAFSGTKTKFAPLFIFVVFLSSALLWSIGILELSKVYSNRAVWTTAVASALLAYVPLTSTSDIPAAALWTAAVWVFLHHLVVDAIMWGSKNK